VLRLPPGTPVVAVDGAGGRRACRLRDDGSLEAAGEIVVEPAPQPPLTIGFAVIKGERPELVVQKLTELGIDRIVPIRAERTVARWAGERAGRRLERLRRVAREAAMQAGRTFLPDVSAPVSFDEAAAFRGAALAERGGGPPSLERPTLLVGPEGGWSDEERAAPLPRVGLGPNVLRAETAAMAGATILAALRHGSVRCVGPSQRLA
jgi:16S rRNA (uracil1498-N3)-methyltransferase